MTTTPDFTGHNGGPPLDPAIFTTITDLYEEARNWADGEPITTPEVAAAITELYDGLHAAGKEADELRTQEKAPWDAGAKAVQDRYNPYVQPKKGKVDMGKAALGALLTAWRTEQARVAADKARLAREEADALKAAADAAIQASSGNLAEREEAEEQLAYAKEAERHARRTDKAATVGLGLRTVWTATLKDEEAALGWAYGRAPERFTSLVQAMAEEFVRTGARAVPGFDVVEGKVAR